MPLVASISFLIWGTLQASRITFDLGLGSIIETVKMGDADKMKLSAYAAVVFSASAFLSSASLSALKGRPGLTWRLALVGSLLAFASLCMLPIEGYPVDPTALKVFVASLVLGIAPAAFRRRMIGKEAELYRPYLRPLDITRVALFSAMTAALTVLTGGVFPSPTGGYTHVGDTVIFFASLAFGSRIGGLVGVLGALGADFYLAYPRWYVSIPAHGLEGLAAGLGKGKPILQQILFCILGGFLMATTYFYVNVFIKGYAVAIISYARDLFGQVALSIALGVTCTKLVERGYLKARRK
ncbi:MAG: ECF transporter S component [Candidatus Brockarchaeota archaeon]|nr:ECF transporter S component [Candidatus Brockarchaeota archaeon]